MLHLIVGNTGSGKRTYSNSLKEKANGIIISIDKWNNTLFLKDKTNNDGLEWFLERIERIENMIIELIVQLKSAGIDSILDLGFSKFEHREKFKSFAISHNYEFKLHFLDFSKGTRFQKVKQRNREKGETYEFEVSKEHFKFMESWFERPNDKELETAFVITE